MHIISRILLAIWACKRDLEGIDTVTVKRKYHTNSRFVELSWTVSRKADGKRVCEVIFERTSWERLIHMLRTAEKFTVPDEVRLILQQKH